MSKLYVNASGNMTTTKPSATTSKYLAIIKRGTMTEGEINALKNAMNKKRVDVKRILKALEDQNDVSITQQQTQKGIDFLMNAWKTPSGRIRKHNPFSDYKLSIIRYFSHFTLVDFENVNATGNHDVWLPIYRVYAKNGEFFNYLYDFHRQQWHFY